MSARDELIEFLREGEIVEGVVFGDWGNNFLAKDPLIVPLEKRNFVISIDEAFDYMSGWSFENDFSSKCYATYIWTNQRVIWVESSDGSTGLVSMPRHPINCDPDMY